MSDRTPELAVLAVLVALVAGALLLGGGGDSGGSRGAAAAEERIPAERIARIERRVEELRGLRFRRRVRVEVMSAEEVRAYGVRESAAATPRAQVAASEEAMKLLGLLEPDVDLDAVTSDIYGEQVAGFYDPRRERLALVRGVGVDDVTLAHELTHALEDQHYDLARFGVTGRGTRVDTDGAMAESGLVEGTATAVMTDYLVRWPDSYSFGEAVGQLWGAAGARPLPPYVMRSLLFPYGQGERFVRRLRAATGDWSLVDNALRDRPPVSTAELYDARRWVLVDRPDRVALPSARELGAGWRLVQEATIGAFDLRELLREVAEEDEAAEIADAWEGGRSALWRRGPLPAEDCAAPCAERDVLALGLRFGDAAGAERAAAALARWLGERANGPVRLARERGVRAGAGGATARWRGAVDALADGGATTGAALAVSGATVRLVLAPTPDRAAALAG